MTLTGMASPAALRRTRLLVPMLLLALVVSIAVGALTAAPRTPPVLLGASADVDGGLARIQGVIPVEADEWLPPVPSPALDGPPGEGLHRVRIMLELTAMEEDGLVFDPSRYAVSGLGSGSWDAVWFSPAPATARQGETVDAVLVFDLPDRAIDLTLELPGGPGLALGPGHHRGGS
ncbi:hypothetical protein [Arthrobacter sp. L77]|uniref:hypothetical protein n=1 Tax=Arthrobacter sp. L77 TaxID=1496689 RepID=UPI000B187F87|nr:hypothetical protein [Arthrobacter sp. L77]